MPHFDTLSIKTINISKKAESINKNFFSKIKIIFFIISKIKLYLIFNNKYIIYLKNVEKEMKDNQKIQGLYE